MENYITCVDEIIKDARAKIINAAYLSYSDFDDLDNYLRKRIDSLLLDIRDELENDSKYDISE
jgi:hypothetical protein